jgi:hypothetical protein
MIYTYLLVLSSRDLSISESNLSLSNLPTRSFYTMLVVDALGNLAQKEEDVTRRDENGRVSVE